MFISELKYPYLYIWNKFLLYIFFFLNTYFSFKFGKSLIIVILDKNIYLTLIIKVNYFIFYL